MSTKSTEKKVSAIKIAGLVAGPLVFAVLMFGTGIEGLPREGQAALAVTMLMAIWWLTEALPIYATALVPLVLFPFTGVLSSGETSANYGNELIYLFLGGFLLSIAVQKWNLHRRIALTIIRMVGFEPPRLILGFMVATGGLSMWISNTASAMIMVPIGLAVITQIARLIEENGQDIDTSVGNFNFGSALMLGIAYSASIGGIATIIGSPPNAIFVAYVKQVHGVEISFLEWMLYGFPVAALGLVGAWVYLTKFAYPLKVKGFAEIGSIVDDGLRELGPMGTAERRVLIVFGMVAGMWVLRGLVQPWLVTLGLGGMSDMTIGMMGALSLFMIRASHDNPVALLEWDDVKEVPWGILLLFGGGLALSSGIEVSGLASWLADRLSVLEGASTLLVLFVITLVVIFLTEVTSNTSTATIFVPIAGILAVVVGVHPYMLMVGVVTAASCAFMLPIATPPNAVVFASGYVTMQQMMRAGIWLNVLFVILITVVVRLWLPLIWGL